MTKLNIASISDIHLGHKKTFTREIISNLISAFPDNSETGELDIIFVAGDVFDDLLSLPDDDVVEIELWVSSLLHICAKHDIVLRILAGTPSHDWHQSELFMTIAKILKINVDIKYIKDVSVEYIEKFGINVLYVPDEANDTTEKTIKQVREILKAKGLSKVDYAVMHGQFDYQLPPFIKAQKHNSKDYLDIVNELIFIGHVHSHSKYERIIAQGSFDRLAHGEEESKGHVRVKIRKNGERNIKFVENKRAKIYKTVECFGLTLEETISKIDDAVSKLPVGSNIRISGSADNAIFSNMNMLIRRYPLLIWSKLVKDVGEEESVTSTEPNYDYVPITITRDNIKELLIDRVLASSPSSDVLKNVHEILDEITK